jgi:hypothetical protein
MSKFDLVSNAIQTACDEGDNSTKLKGLALSILEMIDEEFVLDNQSSQKMQNVVYDKICKYSEE